MSKHKFLIFMSVVLAVAFFALSSGNPLAQTKVTKDANKEAVTKDVVKGKVTRDDVARYLGKVTPSEQQAAAQRNRELGLLPGVAGRTAQAQTSGATR